VADEFFRELFSGDHSFCRYRLDRMRADSAENNFRIFYCSILRELQPNRHTKHRKIERAAAPELPVGCSPAVDRRQMDLGQQLIGTLIEVTNPVIIVEFRSRYHALSRGGNQLHSSSDRHHHGGAVAGLNGPAPGTRGATQQISPSFFMQKWIALRHS